MKVIFLKDVKGQGQRDQIKEVSDGYAMNALIPNGLAVQAIAQTLAVLEERTKKALAASAAEAADAARAFQKLHNTQVTIAVRANEKGHLYEQLSPEIIGAAIRKEYGVAVPFNSIHIEDPIKILGEYRVLVRLEEHAANIALTVVKK